MSDGAGGFGALSFELRSVSLPAGSMQRCKALQCRPSVPNPLTLGGLFHPCRVV